MKYYRIPNECFFFFTGSPLVCHLNTPVGVSKTLSQLLQLPFPLLLIHHQTETHSGRGHLLRAPGRVFVERRSQLGHFWQDSSGVRTWRSPGGNFEWKLLKLYGGECCFPASSSCPLSAHSHSGKLHEHARQQAVTGELQNPLPLIVTTSELTFDLTDLKHQAFFTILPSNHHSTQKRIQEVQHGQGLPLLLEVFDVRL